MDIGDGLLPPTVRVLDQRVGEVSVTLIALMRQAGFRGEPTLAEALAEFPQRTYELHAETDLPGIAEHLAAEAARDDDTRGAIVLVRAHRKLIDGTPTWCDHTGHPLGLEHDSDTSEVWMLLQPFNFLDLGWLVAWHEPAAGPLVVCDYGGTHAQNWARSCALSIAAEVLMTPGVDGREQQVLRRSLGGVHSGWVEETDPDVREFLEATLDLASNYLRGFCPAPIGQLPPPRLIKTARAAEEYAADVMRSLAFIRVEVTPLGADGGIDVTSEEAIAQVKMEGVPTSRPVLQAIYGLATHQNKQALMFSLGGYTEQAAAWADEVGIGLFEFEFDGSVRPRSPVAQALLNGYGRRATARGDNTPGVEPQTEPATVGLVSQLANLSELRQEGLLTAEEFTAAKARLLS